MAHIKQQLVEIWADSNETIIEKGDRSVEETTPGLQDSTLTHANL